MIMISILILSAILLSMLKTVLSTLNMIKSLTSCSNLNWMLNLNVFLPHPGEQTFKSSQLISMQGNFFQLLSLFNHSNKSVVINWKMYECPIENSIF